MNFMFDEQVTCNLAFLHKDLQQSLRLKPDFNFIEFFIFQMRHGADTASNLLLNTPRLLRHWLSESLTLSSVRSMRLKNLTWLKSIRFAVTQH